MMRNNIFWFGIFFINILIFAAEIRNFKKISLTYKKKNQK